MKKRIAVSVCLLGGLVMFGQQPQTSKTSVDSQGNREVLDIATGATDTQKDGKVIQHINAADLTQTCAKLDDPDWRRIMKAVDRSDGNGEWVATSSLCEEWGELQPKTRIERMPFSQVMVRLLEIAPPSSTFARYRGMELTSKADSVTYDATILPSDLGYEPSCKVEAEDRHSEGMLYTYECSVKTPSFPAALDLRNRLVASLASLHLTEEDEIREHGLAANARSLGYCSPDGECLEGHIYVTATKDWKTVQIEPNPIFIRSTLAEISAMKAGRHAPINGIASDSADFSFRILSVGPHTADGLGQATGDTPTGGNGMASAGCEPAMSYHCQR